MVFTNTRLSSILTDMEDNEHFNKHLDSEKERIVARNQTHMDTIRDLVQSSPEYQNGESKLDFQYQLEDGEILRATENEDGIATIVIERDGDVLVDLKDYIPDDFKIVTATYLRTHKLEKDYKANWSVITPKNQKLVVVGDMRDIRQTLILFHEFGHTKFEGWNKGVTKILNEQRDVGLFKKEEAYRNFIEASSTNERGAWAEALKIVRQIRKQYGVDLLGPIKDLKSLKQIIYAALATHRDGREFEIVNEAKHSKVDFDERAKENILILLKDVKKLFDKEKLID